jgi:hypothetical protein
MQLKRTNATSLSDDELTLLDVMFDCGVPYHMLRQCMFMDYFNREPHNLDDVQLRNVIDRFCQQGILTSESEVVGNQNRVFFQLTGQGGALWESERTPIWEHYATDQYRGTRSGKTMISILAVSENVLDTFWQFGTEVGMWPNQRVRIRRRRLANRPLISWKTFPEIFAGVAILEGRDPLQIVDGTLFDARRSFWRDVLELQKFLESDRQG